MALDVFICSDIGNGPPIRGELHIDDCGFSFADSHSPNRVFFSINLFQHGYTSINSQMSLNRCSNHERERPILKARIVQEVSGELMIKSRTSL